MLMAILEIFFSFLSLIILEIVLGIDNLIFLLVLTDKLPQEQRAAARRWGLTFAWVTRLLLLASVTWIIQFTHPISPFLPFSLRDLFLILGGLFLILKATQEIHNEFHFKEENESKIKKNTPSLVKKTSFKAVIIQVGIMDIIFSLDSVLTAVGLTPHFWVMAISITCAILVMIYASEPVSRFIYNYPTIKMLALSFLILIGVILIADGFSFHVPRGYIYFAIAFSLGVEMLNISKAKKRKK